MTNTCVICEKVTTPLFRRKIANDEVVCEDCFKKARTLTLKQITRLKKVTADEIRQSIIDSVGEEVVNFKPTKLIGSVIQFDDENQKIMILAPFNSRILDYSDIVNFELLEDGNTVTSGGLGRALVGGVLFGGTGAVVGAVTGKKKNKNYCTNLQIKLTVRDMNQPTSYITFINGKTKTSSSTYTTAYNEAQECMSVLQLVCDKQQ